MVAESKAITVTTDGPWTQAQLDLIRRTVAADANKDELALFLYQAQRTGLDPLARQIHCVKRGNKIAIQVAIDGYRLIADRTGKYAGNDDPVYQMPAGVSEDSDHAHPAKATVTVWKIAAGVRCAFTATARWEEYCPEGTQAFMWRKMPFLMLGKVAESLALRKAFPAELSGVYTQEEMDQAEVVEATVRMQPVPPTQQASQSARPAQARPPATTCADCGKTIVDAQIGAKVYKAASVEQGAIKEFGRALCYSCGQREAAKRQGQAHEAAVQGQASAPAQGEMAAEVEDRAF